MHAFDILGDPIRRRILELLADGERPAGEVGALVQAEFAISQPAVSLHLRVLRDGGFASVRPIGARRFYSVAPGPLREIDAWLGRYRRFWTHQRDALETGIARGSVGQPLAETSSVAASASKKKKRKHRKRKHA